jgi:hypothetical protein
MIARSETVYLKRYYGMIHGRLTKTKAKRSQDVALGDISGPM